MGELNIETLDVSDAEILNTPEPIAEPTPEPVASPVASPVVEQVERVRDPVSGRFQPQAPAAMPDPVQAVVEPVAPAPVAAPVAEQRQIPLAAHLEERRRFQAELQSRDQRLQEIQQQVVKLTPPPAPPPDFIEDPKAYIDGANEQTRREVEALKAEAGQLVQAQQFTNFVQEIGHREAEFLANNPDYYDALEHVRTVRTNQLLDLYPGATQEQITQTLKNEELQAAGQLMQMGRSPAEGFYKHAKTLGYNAKAAAVAALAMPAVPKAPVGDPTQTLGSSGGAPSDEIGVEDLGEDALGPLKEAFKERFKRRG